MPQAGHCTHMPLTSWQLKQRSAVCRRIVIQPVILLVTPLGVSDYVNLGCKVYGADLLEFAMQMQTTTTTAFVRGSS